MENLVDVFVLLCRTLHEAAEIVGPRELFQKLFGLMGLRVLVVNQIALVLDQQTGNECFCSDVDILFDKFFPLDCFLDCRPFSGRADYNAAFLRTKVPRAPRRYILETALKRSWPAMSQSCRRMGLPSRVDFSLARKSQPIVGRTFSSNL